MILIRLGRLLQGYICYFNQIGQIAARIYVILIRLGRLLQGYICDFNQIGQIAARIYMLF